MNEKLEQARKKRLAHNKKDDLLRFILKSANLDRAQNLDVIKTLFPEMLITSSQYAPSVDQYISNCCDEDLASLVGDMFSLKFME